MTVTMQLFASLAEATGQRQLTLDLPEGATVADALAELSRLHPRLSGGQPGVATAVNLDYVGRGHQLHDGDDLALIGPVSGG